MNWYKISKMMEFSDDSGKPAIAYCQKCSKWATENHFGQEVWKPYFKMTPKEQAQMDKYREDFQMGDFKIKPTICPSCKRK